MPVSSGSASDSVASVVVTAATVYVVGARRCGMSARGSRAYILRRIVGYGALAAVGVVATGCVRRCASRSILSNARRDGVVEVRPTAATSSATVYVVFAGEIGSSTRVRCAYVFRGGIAGPICEHLGHPLRCHMPRGISTGPSLIARSALRYALYRSGCAWHLVDVVGPRCHRTSAGVSSSAISVFRRKVCYHQPNVDMVIARCFAPAARVSRRAGRQRVIIRQGLRHHRRHHRQRAHGQIAMLR